MYLLITVLCDLVCTVYVSWRWLIDDDISGSKVTELDYSEICGYMIYWLYGVDCFLCSLMVCVIVMLWRWYACWCKVVFADILTDWMDDWVSDL